MVAVAAAPSLTDEERHRRVQSIGVPEYVLGPWLFSNFLNRFVPAFAALATLERRQDLLGIALDLVSARPRTPNQPPFEPTPPLIDALTRLANNAALAAPLRDLLNAEPADVAGLRERILQQVGAVPRG